MPEAYYHLAPTALAIRYDGTNLAELQAFLDTHGVQSYTITDNGDSTVSVFRHANGSQWLVNTIDPSGGLELAEGGFGGPGVQAYTAEEFRHRFVAAYPGLP